MNVVRGNTSSRAPNTILINVYLRARQHAVWHQGNDFYQIIENNFAYSIVGSYYFTDSDWLYSSQQYRIITKRVFRKIWQNWIFVFWSINNNFVFCFNLFLNLSVDWFVKWYANALNMFLKKEKAKKFFCSFRTFKKYANGNVPEKHLDHKMEYNFDYFAHMDTKWNPRLPCI